MRVKVKPTSCTAFVCIHPFLDFYREKTNTMPSKLEEYLGMDTVNLLLCLFDSGKVLNDYKICGNRFGSTVLLRLADHNMSSQPRFPTGKSPSKQRRDIERHHRRHTSSTSSTKGSGAQQFTCGSLDRPCDYNIDNNNNSAKDIGQCREELGSQSLGAGDQKLSVSAESFYPLGNLHHRSLLQNDNDDNDNGVKGAMHDNAIQDGDITESILLQEEHDSEGNYEDDTVSVLSKEVYSDLKLSSAKTQCDTTNTIDKQISSNMNMPSNATINNEFNVMPTIDSSVHTEDTSATGDAHLDNDSLKCKVNKSKNELLQETCMSKLMDKSRNRYFQKVVSDRRGGAIQLIGLTDDLLIIYDMDENTDTVFGVWEADCYEECKDSLGVLKKWKGLKGNYDGREDFEVCLDVRVQEIRNGKYDLFDDVESSDNDSK